LRNHDHAEWQRLKDEAKAQIAPQIEVPLIGSDIDPTAIAAARRNAERAGLTPDAIEFEVRDARELRPPEGIQGWIVTNPPYGERMAFRSDDATEHNPAVTDPVAIQLWQEWAQTLKAHFGGWEVYVITTDRQLPGHMRLSAKRRAPVYNGALECRLFGFELVEGSFRQKL